MSLKIEQYDSEVAYNGLNSAKSGTLSGALTLSGVTKFTNSQVPNFALSSTTSTAANATITATAALGGLFVHTETGAGGTVTLPLGTTLTSIMTGAATGSSFDLLYVNNGTAGTGTITGATGTTVVGNAAVPTGKNANLLFYCSGTNTWNIYTSVSA